MKILIFEADHHGHRLMGVRVLVEALLELKAEQQRHTDKEPDHREPRENDPNQAIEIVLALTDAGATSEEYSEHLARLSTRVNLVPLPAVNAQQSPWRVALSKIRALHHVLREQQPAHLYVPYGDGMLQVMSLLHWIPGMLRWPTTLQSEVLMMRGGFAYPGARRLQRLLTLFSLRFSPFTRIHMNDPIPFHYLQQHHPQFNVQLLPDPISTTQVLDKTSARAALNLPLQARIIGCAGVINERKGVHRLLDSFWQIPEADNDDVYLLLAGKHDQSIRRLLAASSNTSRVLSLDRYLTDTELNQAICALDLMVSPYADFTGSVSMVLRAAAAGRMNLTADTAWMKLVVSTFNLGKTCNVKDASELTAAIMDSLPTAVHFQLSESAHRVVAYGQIDNVNAHWTDLLRERLGFGRHAALRSWPTPTTQDNLSASTKPGQHA